MNLAQLQAQAAQLGLTETDIHQIGNPRYKTTWAEAIRLKQMLDAEAENENQVAQAAQAYSSPSAAMVVPAAALTAVGVTLLRGLSATADLIAKKTR